jgi:hypothetical protein
MTTHPDDYPRPLRVETVSHGAAFLFGFFAFLGGL